MKTLSLYEEIKASGVEFGNHYSDLYFLSTPETKAILAKYPLEKGNATTFVSHRDKKLWIDVPFAFLPYWEAKLNRKEIQINS